MKLIISMGAMLFVWALAIYLRFRSQPAITPRRSQCLICRGPLDDSHDFICEVCVDLGRRAR